MKPFRGAFLGRPQADEFDPSPEPRLASPAPVAEVAPGLVPPRPGPKHLLWEVLVELGFVDERRVLEAEAVARAARQDLGAVLLERGLVSSEQLARAVAQREGVLFADLETYAVDERAASLITPAVAERYGAIPIGYGPGGEVLVALANPRDRHIVNDISMMVEPSVTRVVATQESIDALIGARTEETYETEPGEGLPDAGVEGEVVETTTGDADGRSEPVAEAADTVTAGSMAPPDEPTAYPPSALEPGSAGTNEPPQWFDAEIPWQPPVEEEVPIALVGDLEEEPDALGAPNTDREADAFVESNTDREPDTFHEPSPDREPDSLHEPSPDREPDSLHEPSPDREPDTLHESSPDHELLESLSRSVGEVERLVRETARGRDADLDAASAESERRLSELLAETERERADRAETERALREQLETERATRDESERKLREDSEVERTSREQWERSLREELETERATRGESERVLREELETERATREALATELAAVRTARDDLARRVASARDLLELGARPFVPLDGRER